MPETFEQHSEKKKRGVVGRIVIGLILMALAGAVGYGLKHVPFFQGAAEDLSSIGTWAFFLLGLLIGVSHCVGMCWPFVLYVSSRYSAPEQKGLPRLMPHLYYNLGRTITYTALGGMAGWAGSIVGMGGGLLGVQKAAAILAGAVLALYGVLGLVGVYTPLKLGNWGPIKKMTASVMKGKPKRPLFVGMILGFLPCGPLYGAFLAAAALGSAWKGALALLLFGLGTIPALLILAFLGNFLTERRGMLRLVSFVLVMAMGVFFVWHGITANPQGGCCH